MAKIQEKSYTVEMNTSLRGLLPFLKKNPHLFRVETLSNCNCIIDGCNACHELWEISQSHPYLSDDAAYSNVVRNFFKSLEKAHIEAYVIFQAPHEDQSVQLERNIQRFNHLNNSDSNYQASFTIHCRNVFGEVLRALGIRTFVYGGKDENLILLAQKLDAFFISSNNSFYLREIPRGYLNLAENKQNFEALHNGLIDFQMKIFKTSVFKDYLKVGGELRNTHILPMLELLMRCDSSDVMKDFSRKARSLYGRPVLRLNRVMGRWSSERISHYLEFLARGSCNEALTIILKHLDMKDRAVMRVIFSDVIEKNRIEKLADLQLVPDDAGFSDDHKMSHLEVINEILGSREDIISSLWDGPLQPLIGWIGSIEKELFGKDDSEETDIKESSDESSDDSDSGGGSVFGEMLGNCDCRSSQGNAGIFQYPQWVHDLLEDECLLGHRGRKFYWFIGVLIRGYFCPKMYPQDIDRISTYLNGMHVRRVIYGVLFKGRLSPEKQDMISVKEFAYVQRTPVECRVRPLWRIQSHRDASDWVEVPQLDHIEDMDVVYLRRFFSLTLTGDSDWLERSRIDDPKCHFNLLFLKSWAMRSHGLRRLDVMAFLLSVLTNEVRVKRFSHIFPWPVNLSLANLPRPPNMLQPDPRVLHGFGQLQSMLDDVCNLNAVLNSPYGLHVGKVQEFFSERLFYLWSCFLNDTLDANMFLGNMFDSESLRNFSDILNLIFDDEDSQGRAPLFRVPLSESHNEKYLFCTEMKFFEEESIKALMETAAKEKPLRAKTEFVDRRRR